jgi:hypothetical protein
MGHRSICVLALTSVALGVGCEQERPEPVAGTLNRADITVDDAPVVITGYEQRTSKINGQIEIQLTAISDLDCALADDEQYYIVTLRVMDPSAIVPGVWTEVAPGGPVEAEIATDCLCMASGSPESAITGRVRFAALGTDGAVGQLSLDLDGDLPLAGGGVWQTDTHVHVDWQFMAPLSAPGCTSHEGGEEPFPPIGR